MLPKSREAQPSRSAPASAELAAESSPAPSVAARASTRSKLERAANYWGAWVSVGAFMATRDWVLTRLRPQAASTPLPFATILELNIVQYLGWGAVGLLALRLARVYPIEGSLWKPGLLQGFAGIPLTVAGVFFSYVVSFALECMGDECRAALPRHVPWFIRFSANYFHYSLLNFWGFQAVINGLDYYRRYKEREVLASRLEAHLAQAQNTALRMQLQPHFLFNALNSVVALIHSDVDAAERMLTRIGDMLRLTLDESLAQEVSLEQELLTLEAYLDIQRQRFSDRLVIEIAVATELLQARVPSLVLQPLVENAFKHGLGRRAGSSKLSVKASVAGTALVLEVQDDGPGVAKSSNPSAGIGLSNTRRRLALLYGENQSLVLRPAEPCGTSAKVTLPLAWV